MEGNLKLRVQFLYYGIGQYMRFNDFPLPSYFSQKLFPIINKLFSLQGNPQNCQYKGILEIGNCEADIWYVDCWTLNGKLKTNCNHLFIFCAKLVIKSLMLVCEYFNNSKKGGFHLTSTSLSPHFHLTSTSLPPHFHITSTSLVVEDRMCTFFASHVRLFLRKSLAFFAK